MICHETIVRVRYPDTDKMKVVYHGVYLEYFEIGRTELFRDLGMPYAEIEHDGVLFPVLEAHLKFRRPARYDDLLRIVTVLDTTISARMRLDYEIYRDQELLASGYTTHAFTTVDGMKPLRPPQRFLQVVEQNTPKSTIAG